MNVCKLHIGLTSASEEPRSLIHVNIYKKLSIYALTINRFLLKNAFLIVQFLLNATTECSHKRRYSYAVIKSKYMLDICRPQHHRCTMKRLYLMI